MPELWYAGRVDIVLKRNVRGIGKAHREGIGFDARNPDRRLLPPDVAPVRVLCRVLEAPGAP